MTNKRRPKNGLVSPKRSRLNIFKKNHNYSTDTNSDYENNNVQNPKLKILSNKKIVGSPKLKKPNKQSETQIENVTKIEITDHGLELENIQTLENIHKDYNEISACDNDKNLNSIIIEDDCVTTENSRERELEIASKQKKTVKQLKLNGGFLWSNQTPSRSEANKDNKEASVCVTLIDDENSVNNHIEELTDSSVEEDVNLEVGLNITKTKAFKKTEKQLTLDGIFALPRKRKNEERRRYSKKARNVQINESLFIGLVKMDIPNEADKTTEDCDVNHKRNDPIETETLEEVKALKVDLPQKIEKPTKKVSKEELRKQQLLNINTTESLKMEELLLKKVEKAKEKKAASGDSPVEASEDSTNEDEPYDHYEKTKKNIYETYEAVEHRNGEMRLHCLLCPMVAETFHQISLHYKFKHKETPIEEMHFCNVKDCKYKTVHLGMLKWHMRRHRLQTNVIEPTLYPCDQCDKVFDQRRGFLIHLKHKHRALSPSNEDYPCATCQFRASTKRKLEAHIYKSHIPDNLKQKYDCNICGFQTLHRDTLRKHLTRIHLNI